MDKMMNYKIINNLKMEMNNREDIIKIIMINIISKLECLLNNKKMEINN